MSFSVSFSPPLAPCSDFSAAEIEDLSDYFVLAMEACRELSEAGGSAFHITGFGSEPWVLDVVYDMSAFVESLPQLLAAVRERREFELDMYSQGVERTLVFRPDGDSVVIECLSRTSWVPQPSTEAISRDELVSMLSRLAVDLARGLAVIKSDLVSCAPFVHWVKGDV